MEQWAVMDKDVIETYNKEALTLSDQYESKTFEEVHSAALLSIPSTPSSVLDVGSGSGRDAAWFAAHGHQVVAVEPADQFRLKAQELHPNPSIRWLSDSLPALEATLSLNLSFDLIWVSAVWMHLPPKDRQRAFRKLSTLLKPNGKIMISLRHGPAPENRKMYPVSTDELLGYTRERGLQNLLVQSVDDTYERPEVWWQTVVLQLPDNGGLAGAA